MRARWRPSAAQIAMGTAALWLAVFAVIDTMPALSMISLFAVAPLIVATAADERLTAIFSAAAVALALSVVMWDDVRRDENYWVRVAAIGITGVMAVVLAGLRRRREKRLVRMSAIAQASQLALLPPLPPEMTGVNIAARFRSATSDAAIGGDLYEIIPTRYGIRVIVGDVRGKGLDAIMLARHVLSAFRRSAVARSALEQVAGEVSCVIKPHLGEEDFVTAALAQITPGGDLTIVNCGHHPPLLRHGDGLEALTDGKADLPLGLDDNFAPFTARWSPGDRLLLYTDGLVESRDRHGDFLPQDEIATALRAADCEQVLDTLMTAVHRYTGGHSHDDMALLLLERGASPRSTANGHPVKATAKVVGPLWGVFTVPVPVLPGRWCRRTTSLASTTVDRPASRVGADARGPRPAVMDVTAGPGQRWRHSTGGPCPVIAEDRAYPEDRCSGGCPNTPHKPDPPRKWGIWGLRGSCGATRDRVRRRVGHQPRQRGPRVPPAPPARASCATSPASAGLVCHQPQTTTAWLRRGCQTPGPACWPDQHRTNVSHRERGLDHQTPRDRPNGGGSSQDLSSWTNGPSIR